MTKYSIDTAYSIMYTASIYAVVVKLVYTLVLGTSAFGRKGSSPFRGTEKYKKRNVISLFIFVCAPGRGFEQGMVRGGALYMWRKSWKNPKVFTRGHEVPSEMSLPRHNGKRRTIIVFSFFYLKNSCILYILCKSNLKQPLPR